MKKPRVSIIASIGKNRELGKNGELIWRISDDLRRVKELTMGHPIIMGSKTHDSIGRPLPGRANIVVSRDTSYEAPGCEVVYTVDDALAKAKELDQEEVFVFGGASIYEVLLGRTDRLYLTMIDEEDLDADVYFPEYEQDFLDVVSEEGHLDEEIPYTFIVLER